MADLKIAASFLLLIPSSIILPIITSPSKFDYSNVQTQRSSLLNVEEDESYVEELPDGHTAFVQTGAALHYFSETTQREGELFFTAGSDAIAETFDVSEEGANALLEFSPSTLHFGQTKFGEPRVALVSVCNRVSSEGVSVHGVLGDSIFCHSSSFKRPFLQPSQCARFTVAFLPRKLGTFRAPLLVHTSVGAFFLKRVSPFYGARVALNGTLRKELMIHNPHPHPLRILEIASSGGGLFVQLLSKLASAPSHVWDLRTFESRAVASVLLVGREEVNATLFLLIKSELVVVGEGTKISLPPLFYQVPFEVTSTPDVYPSNDVLDFGTLRFGERSRQLTFSAYSTIGKHLNSEVRKIVVDPEDTSALYLEYASPPPIIITSPRLGVPGATVPIVKAQVDTSLLNIDASEVSVKRFSGRIIATSKAGKHNVSIRSVVLEENDGCLHEGMKAKTRHALRVRSRLPFPVAVYNLSLPLEGRRHFAVRMFERVVELRPLCLLQYIRQAPSSFVTYVTLFTYVSTFDIPIQVYDGRLEIELHSAENHHNFNFGLIERNDSRVTRVFNSFEEDMVVSRLSSLSSLLSSSGPSWLLFEDVHSSPPLTLRSGHLSNLGRILLMPPLHCLSDYCYLGLELHTPDGQWFAHGLTLPANLADIDAYLYRKKLACFDALVAAGRHRVNSTIVLNTTRAKQLNVPVSGELTWPRLLTRNSIHFPLTALGNLSIVSVTLTNPSSAPVIVQLMPLAVYPDGEAVVDAFREDLLTPIPELVEMKEIMMFTLRDSELFDLKQDSPVPRLREELEKELGMGVPKFTLSFILQPHAKTTIRLGFLPSDYIPRSSLLIIRNNLTMVEPVVMYGRGARIGMEVEGLTSRGRQPLLFEIRHDHLEECDNPKRRMNLLRTTLTVRRPFAVQNTGEVPFSVVNMSINDVPCENRGFRILNCYPFRLRPTETYNLEVAYTPDFLSTTNDADLQLYISMNGSVWVFPLAATIPADRLSSCHSALPRPLFEHLMYYCCVAAAAFCLICMMICAYLEGDRAIVCAIRNDNAVSSSHSDLNNSSMSSSTPITLTDSPSTPIAFTDSFSPSSSTHSSSYSFVLVGLEENPAPLDLNNSSPFSSTLIARNDSFSSSSSSTFSSDSFELRLGCISMKLFILIL